MNTLPVHNARERMPIVLPRHACCLLHGQAQIILQGGLLLPVSRRPSVCSSPAVAMFVAVHTGAGYHATHLEQTYIECAFS